MVILKKRIGDFSMIVPEIGFTLKDGRNAVLRCPEEKDISGTLDYLALSAAETEFVMRTPQDLGRYTPEKEKIFFEDSNADPNVLVLVCEVDGRIAGNCEIRFGSMVKNRHRGTIGIALIREFWNLGIGTQMFREMICVAETRPEVIQIELEYAEGNTRARALYEKMGFRITGMHPNALRMSDGSLKNEYLMIREITHD